jgi:hypothetical protein
MVSGLAALVLLLSAGAAEATTNVIVLGDTAISIQNLDVDGTLYDVLFRLNSADEVYGVPPVFDFVSLSSAEAAMDAVNGALNVDADDPLFVGPSSSQLYQIGFGVKQPGSVPLVEYVLGFQNEGDWFRDPTPNSNTFGSGGVWADFSPADDVPEPGAALLLGLGLTGVVVVRRRSRRALPW